MRALPAILFLAVAPGLAGSLEVQVLDHKGRPVPEAVVAALPAGGAGATPAGMPTVVIDQVGKVFEPHVTAIRVGTPISFPNRDNFRHHVYSFSEPKKFELPLYKGTPTEPIVFDHPGVVVLGCNIHDWMLAYVYILDTPFFALTDESGVARLESLPAGDYEVVLHHPRAKGDPPTTAVAVAAGNAVHSAEFAVRLKPDFRRSGGPKAGGRDYR